MEKEIGFRKSIIICGPPRTGNSLMSLGIAYRDFEKSQVLLIDGRKKFLTEIPFWLNEYTDKIKCVIVDDFRNPDDLYHFFKLIGRPFEINIMGVGKKEIEMFFIINLSLEIPKELLNATSFKARFDVINNFS